MKQKINKQNGHIGITSGGVHLRRVSETELEANKKQRVDNEKKIILQDRVMPIPSSINGTTLCTQLAIRWPIKQSLA